MDAMLGVSTFIDGGGILGSDLIMSANAIAGEGLEGISSWVKDGFSMFSKETPATSRQISSISKEASFELAPRVLEQLKDPRLGSLAGKLDSNFLNKLANSPNTQFLYDKSSNYINVVQEVNGKLLRITVLIGIKRPFKIELITFRS